MSLIKHYAKIAYLKIILLILLIIGFTGCEKRIKKSEMAAEKSSSPNIIFILADDMGYGDMTTYNPGSKISTPNIDKMAEDGMKFTDAHAAAAWCTPSRFGLLTGRYPMNRDMDWTKGSLITPDLTTIAEVLKKQGYTTGCIGKWHLGFDNVDDWRDFDYSKSIKGGPVDKGFDYFFGIHASLDIGPYFYIYNRHTVEAPTDSTPGHQSDYVTKPKRKIDTHVFFGTNSRINSVQGAMWRPGKIAPHFKFEQVTPALTDSALAFIERESKNNGTPFFLYYAMTGPHTPWVPLKQFQGKSGAGPYGDFVMEIDYEVGRIVKKLKDLNISDNTIIVFASDNGPVWFKRDVERYHHSSTYIYRGMKADFWEGGHRVPLIIDWPGNIKAGIINKQLVSYTDMLATFADIGGAKLDSNVSRDSYDMKSLLLNNGISERNVMPEQDKTIRKGNWKLIYGSGMGDLHGNYGDDDYAEFQKIKFELYNLEKDPSETTSLYNKFPEKVDSLKFLMKQLEKREFQDIKK
ncbi:MAG: arylsulfatase [Ignavibacteriaceae bacterium]